MEASTSATLLWTGAVVALGLGYWFVCVMGAAEVKGKRAAELKMGSITRNNVHAKYSQYWSFFRRPKELSASAAAAANVPNIINTYYDLITDITEWGWGQSIHFSPAVPVRSHRDATASTRSASPTSSPSGPNTGCSTSAVASEGHARHRRPLGGAHRRHHHQPVPGRPRPRPQPQGRPRWPVVCGNFLEMPFEDASFDAAYSIEATCHAPHLEDVYGEIFRVLKPGGMYVTYEWVTTPLYRADDAGHVETVHGIERGSALPGIRAQEDIGRTARKVGFEVVEERDLALPPAGPWWVRLKMGRLAYWRNHILLSVLTFLRIAPKGVVEVHEMLYETAIHLTRGGETGIFTPMHMILCRKPLLAAAGDGAGN
uniref:Methyltransferase n=1 Tax=Ananas comosus var. bracteatus TaxID=296719 RepID=A0A6V7QPD2_ANACO|nr:unnamed protein product [Ananas comosus var. bracteatus]